MLVPGQLRVKKRRMEVHADSTLAVAHKRPAHRRAWSVILAVVGTEGLTV